MWRVVVPILIELRGERQREYGVGRECVENGEKKTYSEVPVPTFKYADEIARSSSAFKSLRWRATGIGCLRGKSRQHYIEVEVGKER